MEKKIIGEQSNYAMFVDGLFGLAGMGGERLFSLVSAKGVSWFTEVVVLAQSQGEKEMVFNSVLLWLFV